jgi:hypothetical protein
MTSIAAVGIEGAELLAFPVPFAVRVRFLVNFFAAFLTMAVTLPEGVNEFNTAKSQRRKNAMPPALPAIGQSREDTV